MNLSSELNAFHFPKSSASAKWQLTKQDELPEQKPVPAERIVSSHHGAHQNKQGMEEVHRILIKNTK